MIRTSVLAPTALVAFTLALAACAASAGSAGGGGTSDSGWGTGAAGGAGGVGGAGGTGAATSGGAGGSGGSGGSGGATDGGTDAGTTTIAGEIVGLLSGAPVVGMQICVYKDPKIPCVTTDANGAYSLSGVPATAEVLLEYTKTSFLPALVTVKTVAGPMSVGQFRAPTQSEANLFASAVGVTLDPTKGHVLLTAFQGAPGSFTGQDGVTASLVPTSGTGPYYMNASGTAPDATLTSTSPSGIGVFANVNPGDLEVSMTHFTKSCQLLSTSWQGSAPTKARIKVVAGYLTGGAGLQCP